MDNRDGPFDIAAEDIYFRSAYNLTHELVYETPAFPIYNFETPPGAPVVPTPYIDNPSLFSASSVAGPGSIAAPSVDPQNDAPPAGQFRDFAEFFAPNTHRGARPYVTLRTLFEDCTIRKGLFVSKGPRRYPVLTRPAFRKNLPDGVEGVWSILSWLMADTGPTLCLEIWKGSSEFQPGKIATLVLQNAIGRKEFKDLYLKYCSSAMANSIVAPAANTTWTFQLATVIHNPFMLIVYKNLRRFVTLMLEDVMEDVRFSTGGICTTTPTMGLTLLPGEFSIMGVHSEPPMTKKAIARHILDKIHPEEAVKNNADTLRKPSEEDIEDAMLGLFLAPSLFKVVNTVVGTIGSSNMALALRQLNPVVKIPTKLVPLAALFIDTEMRTVAKTSGVRVALVQNFRALSQDECNNFKKIMTYWKRFMIADKGVEHRHYAKCKDLIDRLNLEHDLQSVYQKHADLRLKERTGGAPYNGLDQLESLSFGFGKGSDGSDGSDSDDSSLYTSD